MLNATANGITIVNFGMGSASAATVMDLLSAIRPKACLFLGKCGGLKKKNKLGDADPADCRKFAAKALPTIIFHLKFPALPAFSLQKPFQQPFAIINVIIGPAPFIPPTAGFGT